jgi:3-hydroxyisobutyrate dehydrogenase-like beta-hydroxyacid dehydrogenase
MSNKTIAVMAAGDMGGGIGAALTAAGHDVITCLAGRGAETRERAERGGFRDVADLGGLLDQADIFLSIVPPAVAEELGQDCAGLMAAGASPTVYIDCNAISPGKSVRIGAVVSAAGAHYVDGSIIGLAPGKGKADTRLYVSGDDLGVTAALAVDGIDVREVSGGIGRASGLKMLYAGLNKGRFSLYATIATAAQAMGLLDELGNEMSASQGDAWGYMQRALPRLPADSERWWPEMAEIADALEAEGVTGGFHRGATSILKVMAATPYAAETRESFDPDRSMEETLAAFVEHLDAGRD